jgi:L-lactate dehydrogenase (cytochrome)
MRALALGARACMIGRAYAWGLGAAGKAGVTQAIDILKNELSVTMALTGVNSVAEIGPQVIAGAAVKKKTARAKSKS